MQLASENENFEMRVGQIYNHELESLETIIGQSLSGDYRYFLKKYGFALWFGGSIPGLADHKSDDYDEEDDVLETHRYYKELYNKDDYQPVQTDGLAINSYSGGGYYFLFSESSPRAGQVGLFLTETYGQEVSKFRSFTDYLSFLVTDSPEPELVDVDYKRILDIIED